MISRNFWRGKKVVITAGPTREALDPVRFLTNASSGRMGYALANEAAKRGARVILISGPTALTPPRKTRFVPVLSARDMLRAALRHARGADLIVGAAAVADWRPERPSAHKLKKNGRAAMSLRLVPNPDILKTLARRRKGRARLVGFALETQNLVPRAARKLKDKSLDLIVANAPDALDKDDTKAVLLFRSGGRAAFKGPKAALARKIFSLLAHV